MRKTMVEYKTDWNRLIAEFMEMTPCLTSEGDFLIKGNPIEAKYLPYATDWNWLMPVVEKIESLGLVCFEKNLQEEGGYQAIFTKGYDILICHYADKSIDATYMAVVEFIKDQK